MRAYTTLRGAIFVLWIHQASHAALPPPCDSDIYCKGPLLHTVQMARLHNDSKHFVDMSMRFDPTEVKANFQRLMDETGQQPTKEKVRQFVEHNFRPPGCEFTAWEPRDWRENPAFLSRIQDSSLRRWVHDLHRFWKHLGREVAGEVYLHPERYSLSFVPNPVIVPGGRFNEYYYWDSYWVMKGLLLSEMPQTVKGMLENFLAMVDKLGFVPNGGRVYFERRSQPPFLIPMVKLYLDGTGDDEFLRTNIKLLEKEFQFWRTSRTVAVTKSGKTYTMFRYSAEVGLPRPESYREDYTVASQTAGGVSSSEAEAMYAHLKSGAESGWDYSSRWFVPQIGEEGCLNDTRTRLVVPVDLNALLHLNARLLSEFFTRLGDSKKSAQYGSYAEQQRRNIQAVLWDNRAGSWFDWDIKNERLNKKFYPSNIFPVWVNASSAEQNAKFLHYMHLVKATSFTSGVPTSLQRSGQQWDFPNGWPPLQLVMIEALNNMATEPAFQLAFQLAQRWINTNYLSYKQSEPNAMFEKYDVTKAGLPGGGGEYDVQLGFGWTNGVVMALADLYGDRLRAPKSTDAAAWQTVTSPLPPLLLLLPLLVVVVWLARRVAGSCYRAVMYRIIGRLHRWPGLRQTTEGCEPLT